MNQKQQKFDIADSIALLEDDLYAEVLNRDTYTLVVSRFKGNYFNFVIPLVSLAEFDEKQASADMLQHQKKGFEFSFYIRENLNESYAGFLRENSMRLDYADLYVYSDKNSPFTLEEDFEIMRMDAGNVMKFLAVTDTCFPDWNNEEFTDWCLNNPNIVSLGLVVEGKLVSFGSYLLKDDFDYVFLLNAGTDPEFRRRGYHDLMIRIRVNEVLAKRENAIFYGNVEKGGGSYHGFKKLGFQDGEQFFVYPIPDSTFK